MSAIRTRRLPWTFLACSSLAAGLLLTVRVSAQPAPDRGNNYLDQMRRQNEVASQKMEADVRLAIREAQRLGQEDPAKAVDRLQRAIAALEEDNSLPEGRRETLIRMLKDRIRVAQAPADPPVEKAKKLLEVAGRKAEEAGKAGETQKTQRDFDTIKDLQQAGKTEEAQRRADDLARRNPDSPAAQSTGRILSGADQLASARQFAAERERRQDATLHDVDRSALPPKGDIEFPSAKEWAEKTKRRQKDGVQLTAKEKAILQALDSSVSVRFKDSRFEDVIEYLSTLSGQPILVDRNALKEADISYDTPVTLQVKGIALRTLLRKVLGEYGLAYVIKDQAIQVTSAVKAKEMMVVRSYNIGDLVSNTGSLGGVLGLQLGQVYGPGVNQFQMMQNVNMMIDMIQNSVDPQSWQANGGTGTITFYAPAMSLVVKQSAEVQAMLSGALQR